MLSVAVFGVKNLSSRTYINENCIGQSGGLWHSECYPNIQFLFTTWTSTFKYNFRFRRATTPVAFDLFSVWFYYENNENLERTRFNRIRTSFREKKIFTPMTFRSKDVQNVTANMVIGYHWSPFKWIRYVLPCC